MQPAPLENTTEPKELKYTGKPRRIKQATLHAETFWPGRMGAETNITPAKYPKLKMLWIPGIELILQWHDGSIYAIPANNIKGLEDLLC